MIKRLLYSFVIAIMLCLSCMCAALAADQETIQNDVAMLRAFGIIDSGIGSTDASMKRGDFFKIVCNLINYSSTEDLITAQIITGTDDGNLQENDALTYNQAVTILVRALGYNEAAQQLGGYPDGYINVANDIGLVKGVSAQETLKKSDIIKMICNACDTEILQLTAIGGNKSTYSTVGGETVLVYYHNIYKVSGIVTQVNNICLNKESGSNSDSVIIAGMYMEAGNVDAEPYLGMNTDTYYRQVHGEEPVLVYVEPTSKNTVITIEADDIVRDKTTKEELVYSIEGMGTDKKLKISPVADMVYNGRGYVNYTAEDMMPEVGEVKLIDNDGDGKYDCMIVTDYRTIFVNRVSVSGEEIFSEYGGFSIDLTRFDEYTIQKTDGSQMSLSEIGKGSVIFLKTPKNGDYAELIVSQEFITGSASTADKSDKRLIIDGVEYKVNREIYDYCEAESKSLMETGKIKVYYLDPAGRIAGYDTSENEQVYGYLYKQYLDDDERMYMVILSDEGKWNTYAAADKIAINDTTVKSQINAVEMIQARQVIRYKLNDQSQVIRIETAKPINDGKDTEYFNKISFTKVYRSPNASFNSEFYLDGNMVIFNIPTGTDETGSKYADNRTNYSVTGNEFEDGQNYTVTLYDVDSNNRARVVAYEKDGSDKTLGKTVFLVDKVDAAAKGDEVLQTVSGIVVGQELSVTADDDTLFSNLKRGDLIRFHINDEGRVDAVGVVQRVDDEWYEEEVLTNALSSSTPAILKGIVTHIDSEEGYIKIRGTDGTRALKIQNAAFSMYDSKEKKVKAIDGADIQINDFAVILASSSDIKSVTVYR